MDLADVDLAEHVGIVAGRVLRPVHEVSIPNNRELCGVDRQDATHLGQPLPLEPVLQLLEVGARRRVVKPRSRLRRIGRRGTGRRRIQGIDQLLAKARDAMRFIDPEAQFVFAPPAEFPQDAIPFDAPGVELSHQGEDCTFETLLKRASLRDRRLVRLAEVVHEADLRDGKYAREEARGIDVAVRALLAASSDDHQVLAQGMALFEGLYATTSRKGTA
jgi:hypothetical protein